MYSLIAKLLSLKKFSYLLPTLKAASALTVAYSSFILVKNLPVGCSAPLKHINGIEERIDEHNSEANYSEYDELVKGKLSYYIPDTMEVGNTYTAKVAVTKAISNSVLLHGLSKDELGKSTIVDSVFISSRVKVSLIDPEGDNFYVKPIDTELQIVSESSNATWKWYVIPKTSGENPLELTVSTRITDKFGSDFRDIPVFSNKIIVKSNYWYSTKNFLEQYWQYIFSAVLIPLIIWGYNLYKSQRENRKKEQNEELQKKEASQNPIGFRPNHRKPD